MTLNGVLNEPVWGETAFTAITDTDCNYGTGCGTTDTGASAQFKAIWNSTGLWIGVVVSDPGTLYADTAAPWNGSAVEIFLDVNNTKAGYNAGTGDYDDPNTYQFGITYNANSILEYHNATARNIMAASSATQGTGYTMEIEIPWANLGVTEPTAGSLSGLDVAVDVANAAGTARDHQIAAYNAGFNAFDQAPAEWGTMAYLACNSYTATNTPVVSSTPTSTISPTFTITPTATATPVMAAYGATLPYTEYRAVAANYTGTLIGPSSTMWMNGGNMDTEIAAESTGREAVQLTNQGQYVRFTTTNQCNSIVVRYVIPDAPGGGGITATLSCAVNGPGVNFNQELTVSSVYSWDYGNFGYPYDKNPGDGNAFHLYDETHALFGQEVPAGSTITLQKGPNDTAGYYVINLIDLEDVAAPMAQPANSVSVLSAGATGNGTTDDTTAIQNCVNNANGQTVWFPQGTYLLSNSININAGVNLQGAGMWYTTLHETNPSAAILNLNLNNASMTVANMFLRGEVTNRNDNLPDSGLNNFGGTNSLLQNVWIEHTKCGWWCGGGGSITNNLMVTGCRIRDTYADGVNFNLGTSNSTVTNCNFRNTGDDAMAGWSQGGNPPNTGNTFSYNTVQNPWRADCFALNGGNNNVIENNACSDTLNQSGILMETGFGSNNFGGNTVIQNNVLTNAGAQYAGNNSQYGAIQLWGNQLGLTGTFTVANNLIQSPTFMGIEFLGPNDASGGVFSGTTINNAGTYAVVVEPGTSGTAAFSTTTVNNPGQGNVLNSGTMTLSGDP
jgi:hypothetical protein